MAARQDHRRWTRWVGLLATSLVMGCGKASPPPLSTDEVGWSGKFDAPRAVPRAGSVGRCRTFFPLPGYRTCLMTVPQTMPPPSSDTRALRIRPLATGLPKSVDHRSYLNGCLEVHTQGACGWCTAHTATAVIAPQASRYPAGGSPASSQ